MPRPRIVAVVSAVAASTVAFLVVSRWRLAGTLGGAALIPFIYTLVSHWSSESLDRAARWLHHRESHEDETASGSAVPTAVPTKYLVTGTDPEPRRGSKRREWLLVGLASAALAVSVYAVASRDPAERVIVRDRVVQEIVTVTLPAVKSDPSTSAGSAPSTIDPGPTAQSGDPSSTTIESTITTTVSSTSPPASSTTTIPVSSTTTVSPTTTTSLP